MIINPKDLIFVGVAILIYVIGYIMGYSAKKRPTTMEKKQ